MFLFFYGETAISVAVEEDGTTQFNIEIPIALYRQIKVEAARNLLTLKSYSMKLFQQSLKWGNPFITISSDDAAEYARMKVLEKDGEEPLELSIDKKTVKELAKQCITVLRELSPEEATEVLRTYFEEDPL